MTTLTTTTASTALAIRPDQQYWDDKQIAALSLLGLRNASKGDLAMFFHQCKRTGLDPITRQIYMIERKGRYNIQTAIDGFRVIADRACAQRGWVRSEEDTIWYDANGKAHTEWLTKTPPVAARYTCVVITPAGHGRFSAVARFEEYAAGGPMWAKMPALMIAKCAEALALRKAFPQDLSGLYTDDEMAQASTPARSYVEQAPTVVTRTAAPASPVVELDADTTDIVDAEVIDEDPFSADDWNTTQPAPEVSAASSSGDGITEPQTKMLMRLKGKLGMDTDEWRTVLSEEYGVTSGKELSKRQASALIEKLMVAAGEPVQVKS
jgi:phage recombination protein Bet